MDGVQLSQGCRAPKRKQFTFYYSVPGITGTHLIYLSRMKDQYALSYFYKTFRFISLSRNFVQFSLKTANVTMVGENFEIDGV